MEHTLTFNEHAMRITLDKNKDIIDRILRSKNAEGTVFSSEIMPINDIMEQCNFDADTWCNIGYFLRYMAKRCTDTMVYASDALMFDSTHTMDEIEHVKLGIAGDDGPTEIDVDVPTLFKIMLSVIYGGAAICDTAFEKNNERSNDLIEAASTVRKTKPKAKAKSKHMIKSTKEK